MLEAKITRTVAEFFKQFTCRDDVWATMCDYGYGQDELVRQVIEEIVAGERCNE